MSLRKLPDVQNFAEPEGFESAPNIDAVEPWNPALRLAGGGVSNDANATVIDILDQIGKDPWTGEGISPQEVADQLKGAKNVICNINSPGGSFYAGVTIYNYLKSHPGKVTVNVLGIAASAASIIAMAGDEINMGPAAFMMIHNGQGACMGDRHDMANAVTNLTAIDAAIRDLYVARTGKHGNSIATMMDNETLMNAADAIKNGFADKTIEKAQIVEDAQASVKAHPLHAKRLADAVFANAGIPRSKRRMLFAQIKNGPNDPIFTAAHEAAAGFVAELRELRTTLKSFEPVNAGPQIKCGADSGLALDMGESWDGAAAKARMFDAAGFNSGNPDPAKARKGFLFYDAAAPNLKGSYHEPFADIVGGELKAVRGGVRAAASRLPQTMGIPATCMHEGRSVLTHYEQRFAAADGAAGGTQNAAKETALKAGLSEIADELRSLLKPKAT